jgi:hypothetical protein
MANAPLGNADDQARVGFDQMRTRLASLLYPSLQAAAFLWG